MINGDHEGLLIMYISLGPLKKYWIFVLVNYVMINIVTLSHVCTE